MSELSSPHTHTQSRKQMGHRSRGGCRGLVEARITGWHGLISGVVVVVGTRRGGRGHGLHAGMSGRHAPAGGYSSTRARERRAPRFLCEPRVIGVTSPLRHPLLSATLGAAPAPAPHRAPTRKTLSGKLRKSWRETSF